MYLRPRGNPRTGNDWPGAVTTSKCWKGEGASTPYDDAALQTGPHFPLRRRNEVWAPQREGLWTEEETVQ